jgi:ATP-dependent RNA helicase HrpB
LPPRPRLVIQSGNPDRTTKITRVSHVTLPVDPQLPEILRLVRTHRALVLSAPPGSGKTTRVPPALAVDGPVIVLQPRRVAARAIAQRIAREQGWTVGEEAGWQVRFERRFSPRTRVLVATEGILTARLQQDPLLSEFQTVVLDEFHERTIHADLGLALARQAWHAREDLRIIVMSATLDTASVAAFLHDCPVVTITGRLHPIDIDYRPTQTISEAVNELLPASAGSLLCFLPGAAEIRRAEADVRALVDDRAEIVPLYGSLPADAQDRAISETGGRRVILATNIAETSLTVPRVSTVIDTGLHKVARFDPDRSVDSLELERIPADAAEQRAGRAGRSAPGRVRRLWSATDRLRPHGEPEIDRIDLCEAALEIIGWSGDPRAFEWFDAPEPDRVEAAMALLARLGAIRDGRLTDVGHAMHRLPIHPRLARMLVESGRSHDVALACAVLSERHLTVRAAAASSSDLLSAIDDPGRLPPHVVEVARRLARDGARRSAATLSSEREREFRRSIFCGYPDRVARRRSPASPRYLLASGHGATLGRDSSVHDAEFIVAVDVQAGRRGDLSEAIIRVASAVDAEWLEPTAVRIAHVLDPTGRVRAIERTFYDEILLGERPSAIDQEEASELLAAAFLESRLPEADEQLLLRLRFGGLAADLGALARRAAAGRTALSEVSLVNALDWSTKSDLERLAPINIRIPSGREATLRYQEDGSVVASVKLQELFGLADTPRVGPRQTPVILSLLAPNGRPVQTTTDLRSFWNTTYQEVRRELRGRYPKHPWPEDPWSAVPTARTKRRV